MVRLSVNVNKVATLRNSRGGGAPSVMDAVGVCVEAGVPGITVHPRADRRHITPDDVRRIAAMLAPLKGRVEYNIEGDPREELLALVEAVEPDQCTLVPVAHGEVTSQGGWTPSPTTDRVARAVHDLRDRGIRVSLFVDPLPESIRWAAAMQADRVELYTEPFARAFEAGPEQTQTSFTRYVAAARLAHSLGLGVNAGHDLDLDNLVPFRELPHLAEVSIGHALMSRALFVGLARVVREYLELLSRAEGGGMIAAVPDET